LSIGGIGLNEGGERMRVISLVAGIVLALAGGGQALADEVGEQIDLGKELYQEGDFRGAVEELQYAISQIQQKLNEEYMTLLPDPLEGWRADEAQAQTAGMAMMGGGTQISRDYYAQEDNGQVNIQILANSPMLAAMSMMIGNPMMMQGERDTKPYRKGRTKGMIKENAKNIEITLLVANRVLITVKGSRVDSKEPVEAYLDAMDLRAVEKAFAG
jgi:hypothetical protein